MVEFDTSGAHAEAVPLRPRVLRRYPARGARLTKGEQYAEGGAASASSSLVTPGDDRLLPVATVRNNWGSWCRLAPGQAADQDYTGSGWPTDWRQFKMVYAYPADRPNRFSTIAPILHVTAGRVASYFGNHYDGFRTPIWDIRTNCPASFSLDILALQLPRQAAAYSGSGLFGTNSSLIMADAKALLQPRIPYSHRNPVVFVDGVQGTPRDTFRGFGELFDVWTQNPAYNLNSYNRGNMSIVVAPPKYEPQQGDTMPDRGVQPALFAHEMMHTLGAVLSGAPNTTGAGFWHCNDERDLMCYPDGGAGWNPPPSERCPPLAGYAGVPVEYRFAERIDCGQDDYFSPAPRGPWLSQNWNTYASYYLGGCSYYYCGVRMPTGSEDD